MQPDLLNGMVALAMISLAVVAKVAATKLTAVARLQFHQLEHQKQGMVTKLMALQGEKELLNRSRSRSLLDKAALEEQIALLRSQIEALEQESQRRNRRLARRLTFDRERCAGTSETAVMG